MANIRKWKRSSTNCELGSSLHVFWRGVAIYWTRPRPLSVRVTVVNLQESRGWSNASHWTSRVSPLTADWTALPWWLRWAMPGIRRTRRWNLLRMEGNCLTLKQAFHNVTMQSIMFVLLCFYTLFILLFSMRWLRNRAAQLIIQITYVCLAQLVKA